LQAWERLLRREPVEPVREFVAMHMDVWRVAQEKVGLLDKELKKASKPFERTLGRLQTAPGVGPITAAAYIAVLATPERSPDSRPVASYVGLVPSSYDTGSIRRRGHITKRGSSELRALLCECAHHAARKDHLLNPYWARVCAKQGYKRAVIAIARRLAGILYAMWGKGEDFDATQLNVVQKPRTVSRTYRWRIKRPQEQLTAV
jgi:transposase